MSGGGFDDFLEFLNQMDKWHEEYVAFKRRTAEFTKELIEKIASATYEYFSEKTAHPDLVIKTKLDEDEIRESIAADEDFKYYGIWIFEELCNTMADFSDDKIPAGRKLWHKKIEYDLPTDETIAAEISEFENKYNIVDPEEREILRRYHKEDAIFDAYYTNFKILVHKTLKKLAVEYFPEISEISATGIRETDYLLYMHMLMMHENIMNIVGDDISVEIPQQLEY